MKWKVIVPLVILALLLAAAAVALFGFWLPHRNAESTMTQGRVELRELQNGSLQLTWPKAEKQDRYLLEIREKGDPATAHIYFRVYTTENTWKLPPLPTDVELTLSIRTVVDYDQLWLEKERVSENELTVTTMLAAPVVQDMQWTADENAKTVTIQCQLNKNEHYRLYWRQEDGSWQQVRDTDQKEQILSFGDEGEFPMPAFGDSSQFRAEVYRQDEDLVFYGQASYEFAVDRDYLLGRELNPVITDEGYNVSTITWEETKGQYYQVQRLNRVTGDWETVAEIPGDAERTYTTGHMAVNRTFTYRVVAVGGQTMPDSDYAAISGDLEQKTKESPLYCTIWPLKNLKTYADPQKTQAVGTIKAGTAWCVVEEQGDMFGIRQDGEIRYVESNHCLINLPEYMADMCSYNITNSYSSIYLVHEFEIPQVTGVVTVGYEKVQMSDKTYLVPLLYPTAKKLADAARTARDKGYQLLIYDAFRPQIATSQIYDMTEKILEEKLPEKPYNPNIPLEKLELPEPKKEINPETQLEEEVPLTYQDVMLGNGQYTLNYFLAKGASMHNYGLALDLTIVSLNTGQEAKMQTSMHDLSCYSVTQNNNKEAKTLKEIMTSAGFAGLISEWWHFQDDEARNTIHPSALWNGVTPNGWMANDNGWRFRNSNGTYIKNKTATIDGVQYTFDENGYVISP